jgi:hypothetical protein
MICALAGRGQHQLVFVPLGHGPAGPSRPRHHCDHRTAILVSVGTALKLVRWPDASGELVDNPANLRFEPTSMPRVGSSNNNIHVGAIRANATLLIAT